MCVWHFRKHLYWLPQHLGVFPDVVFSHGAWCGSLWVCPQTTGCGQPGVSLQHGPPKQWVGPGRPRPAGHGHWPAQGEHKFLWLFFFGLFFYLINSVWLNLLRITLWRLLENLDHKNWEKKNDLKRQLVVWNIKVTQPWIENTIIFMVLFHCIVPARLDSLECFHQAKTGTWYQVLF